jgi:hypothetical protein
MRWPGRHTPLCVAFGIKYTSPLRSAAPSIPISPIPGAAERYAKRPREQEEIRRVGVGDVAAVRRRRHGPSLEACLGMTDFRPQVHSTRRDETGAWMASTPVASALAGMVASRAGSRMHVLATPWLPLRCTGPVHRRTPALTCLHRQSRRQRVPFLPVPHTSHLFLTPHTNLTPHW